MNFLHKLDRSSIYYFPGGSSGPIGPLVHLPMVILAFSADENLVRPDKYRLWAIGNLMLDFAKGECIVMCVLSKLARAATTPRALKSARVAPARRVFCTMFSGHRRRRRVLYVSGIKCPRRAELAVCSPRPSWPPPTSALPAKSTRSHRPPIGLVVGACWDRCVEPATTEMRV